MIKVYVVLHLFESYTPRRFVGVYSTKLKATKAILAVRRTNKYYDSRSEYIIKEWELE